MQNTISIVIALFCMGCINDTNQQECVREVESDSFWVYDNECLKNSDLGLDENGIQKIDSSGKYSIFSDCLQDIPHIDFNTHYLMVAKIPQGDYHPYIQEIRLLETCSHDFSVEIKIYKTPLLEVNVFKLAFIIFPIEDPQPKIDLIWL